MEVIGIKIIKSCLDDEETNKSMKFLSYCSANVQRKFGHSVSNGSVRVKTKLEIWNNMIYLFGRMIPMRHC